MHLVLPLPEGVSDHALCMQAMRHGLSPRPLTAYATGGISGFNGLVMGYANTPEHDMGRHVKALAGMAAKCSP